MLDTGESLQTIHSLMGEKFFIPSYQRGYRWNSQQVNDLLNDLFEFFQKDRTKDEYYCLQPIIVKKHESYWELIDGQQRITTIYIILTYFNERFNEKFRKKLFDISYQTRPSITDFLNKIEESEAGHNVDFSHIYEVYEAIFSWFSGKENIINDMESLLLNNTRIIWYEVSGEIDSRQVFSRVNMGKIPLTNAELIKALFLQEKNFGYNQDVVKLKQLEIASEWDAIELFLQNDEFWYFLNVKENNYYARIEFIFDLMSEKVVNNDAYVTFRYFYDELFFSRNFQIEKIEKTWRDIKNYHLMFREWFDDHELYHLIGYLITIGRSVNDIKKISDNLPKKVFKIKLKEEIKNYFSNCQLDKLEYGKNTSMLTRLFLLFNIQYAYLYNDAQHRFPFIYFKHDKWSLEHIHAQNSDGLSTVKQWTTWLEEHRESLERINANEYKTIISEINDKLKEEITKEAFDCLFDKIVSLFEKSGSKNIHDIANLALLDKDSNSSLNKSIFEVKRKRIIEKEINNAFIPVCTRNVFLKYFTKNPDQLYYWSTKDRDDYRDAIFKALKDYLPTQISGV
jgi:uncharacterized protein with ParB-like and HNH nuclease domain